MNFPNRELLSCVVFAFPVASIFGLRDSTFFSTFISVDEHPEVAKYCMTYFADTVLPAPDSADTRID
jgi:hypothetical protein